MNHAIRLKQFLSSSFAILVQFAHGGLVITGLVVALLIGGRIGMNGVQDTQTQLKGWISTLWVLDKNESLVQTGLAPAQSLLTPDMRRVADYLARRYHVAPPAVEPLVATAHAMGSRLGLDPLLILAVMAIESSFNPFAESHLGAQGLMQVIPKYHQDILAEQDQEHPLLDPVTNIEVGAKVLKESIRRAGNLKDGLQQYGGATDDRNAEYANKVLAIKQQLDQAKRDARQIGDNESHPGKRLS